MFYSSRAAAYISLKEFTKAIQDARRTIAIRPKWAKGHARLAAAHFALQDYSEVSFQGSMLDKLWLLVSVLCACMLHARAQEAELAVVGQRIISKGERARA